MMLSKMERLLITCIVIGTLLWIALLVWGSMMLLGVS